MSCTPTAGCPRAAAPAPGRVEDRIRAAKDTGLANLPLHHNAANAVWIRVVLLAIDPQLAGRLDGWTESASRSSSAVSGALATSTPAGRSHWETDLRSGAWDAGGRWPKA
jgi:hypothetical protein